MKRNNEFKEPRDLGGLGVFLSGFFISAIFMLAVLNGTATDAELIPGGWLSVGGVVFISALVGFAGYALVRDA